MEETEKGKIRKELLRSWCRIKIGKISILPKAIYKFNEITIKLTMENFVNLLGKKQNAYGSKEHLKQSR